MGRGGPPEPEVVTVPPTVESLVELSRSGRHAASDHLETAALVGVATVGCRRCGGGLAGAVATSNVAEGARVAVELEPDVVVFDGSGAAFPPVAADRTVVVVGGHQDPRVAAGYLNAYRLLLADLVVVTMAELRHRLGGRAGGGADRPCDRACRSSPRRFDRVRWSTFAAARSRTSARRRPRRTPASARTSRTSTAPRSSASPATSRTARRCATSSRTSRPSVYLVELKAAAIDVVAEAALARGARGRPRRERRRTASGSAGTLTRLLLDMAKFQ